VLEPVQLHGEAGGRADSYSLQLHDDCGADYLLAAGGMQWSLEQRFDLLHWWRQHDVPNLRIGIEEGIARAAWSAWIDPVSALLVSLLLVAFVLHPTEEDRWCGSLCDD